MKRTFYKNIICAGFAFSLFFNNVYAFNRDNVSVTVNNLLQPVSTNVINKEGNILIAFRDLFNMIGAEIDWNSVKRTITAKKDNNTLVIYIDSDKSQFNDKDIKFPVSIEIIDNVTYVPLRFICELFGFDVDWNGEKKNVSVYNNYGEYLFLKENIEEDTITLEKAMEIAKSNNSNLKNLEDTERYIEKINSGLRRKLTLMDNNNLLYNSFPLDESQGLVNEFNSMQFQYLNSTIGLIKSIKSTDEQAKNKSINEKIITDGIELSLITSLISIKNTKLMINSTEKSVELGKSNIKNLELKNKYGMISEKELKEAKTTQKNLEQNLDTLKLNLISQESTLKDILGSEKDFNIAVNMNVDFKELDKINLERYINDKIESDLSIQILKSDVSVQQYNKDTSIIAEEEERIKEDNDLNIAKRKLKDAQENLEIKIRNTYNELKKMADKDELLKISLNEAIDNYNITMAKYISGKITAYDVEQAKLKILNDEKNIEENKLNFFRLLYNFSKPYLL